MSGLAENRVQVRLRGTAGQSLGAFLCQGITLEVFGDANDYVGKGLSGGRIIVRPPVSSPLVSQHNSIVGNTEIGRASCRERVCQYVSISVVAVSFKKKIHKPRTINNQH